MDSSFERLENLLVVRLITHRKASESSANLLDFGKISGQLGLSLDNEAGFGKITGQLGFVQLLRSDTPTFPAPGGDRPLRHEFHKRTLVPRQAASSSGLRCFP